MGGFINPYTFIPVNDGNKKSLREYYNSSADLISGKIECTLFTRSQIALCDEVSEGLFDFFNVNGKPVIPGSSLRGTIRSLYEALTDSCFSSTNDTDEDYFSSRLNKNKCGLLCMENGKYVLYEAKRYKDESNKWVRNIPEGTLVTFNSYTSEKKKNDEAQDNNKKVHEEIFYFRDVNSPDSEKKGYVHKVNRILSQGRQNLDSVFEKVSDTGINIRPYYINRFEVNIKKSLKALEKDKDKLQKLVAYNNQFEEIQRNEKAMLPVWYCYLDGHYYFAPSQMSRAVFYNKPIDLLRNKRLEKCADINNICDACALFGTVNDDGFALSSRVRFGDAVCVTPDCLDESYILDILGAPRLSSFEFYLKYKGKDKSYTADTPGVEIAGRKYYWHNRYIASHPICKDAVVKENLKRKVQLVKKGSEFRFTVYFDKITGEQLRKLAFTLTLGDNRSDSKQCHKIGHGKPLGLGSAKIVCDRITVRKFEYPEYIEKDMTDIINPDLQNVFENQTNVDNVLKVTNINTVNGKYISYPYSTDGNGVFKWFANNRPTLKKIGEPLKYIDKLPKLTDEDQTLICNSYQGNKKRSSQKK
ncbi:TIGR03986 family type III CRISPR-associated RAMP protein [Ruminococcus flavefaciens]|uniref:TIGR03986 family type III CRISPR-associated RAMP protein n=1 Tax=Ruminococcus flavefaciens TaxID=1265 RepID=UPI000466978E|nr:TIGR03986 family CRISPR-associated RAMP protein [Ruminococcus flavefaciens]